MKRWLLGAALLACATEPEKKIEAPEPGEAPTRYEDLKPAPKPEEPPAERAAPRAGEIARADVDTILRAGPARFLAAVDTEAVLRDGKFLGWRLKAWRDPSLAEAGVRPGDIVTRINRRPIERPEAFSEVWEGLRRARELVVDVIRDGKPMTLRYPIR